MLLRMARVQITLARQGRGPLDRGYSLSTVSSRVEAVAQAFEEQVDRILALATSEMRLRRLAQEIGQTTRWVNPLENVLIARLVAQRDYIQTVLEERERESRKYEPPTFTIPLTITENPKYAQHFALV